MQQKSLSVFTVAFFTAILVFGQTEDLHDLLKGELKTQFEELSKKSTPAYFMSYRVADEHAFIAQGAFGSLTQLKKDEGRTLNVDVRVGSYEQDHSGGASNHQGMGGFGAMRLPLNDSPEAIRQAVWLAADLKYKTAMQAFLMRDKSEEQQKKDFTRAEPTQYLEKPKTYQISQETINEWSEAITGWSSIFKEHKDLVEGSVSVRFTWGTYYFLSTEGADIRQNQSNAEIQIAASIRSEDGNIIPLHKSYFAADLWNLPAYEEVATDIEEMTEKLLQLQNAPLAEPYAGPAIFSGGASGVFFHEIFGHRIEADRLTKNDDAQTFKDKIGKRILPKFLNVTCDPTLQSIEGEYLSGTYTYDDQGVKSQKVTLVENGILKDFLRSRKPLFTGEKSNGHARAQAGLTPMSRQSNLLVTSSNQVSDEKLRKALIKVCKKQKREFGLFIEQVAGGYTMTNRYTPNAFHINPTVVYKVYTDGRPDELVRGVDLIGTPLTMFSEIEATGTQRETFYGYCGAESGYVPVTATSPAIFVGKIETQKKPEVNIDSPILTEPN
ncbi:TldD/PmbA family protein [Marinoscillum furvescens]|uniref:Putative Zn-dependent protease n=1 Tax=Marinoscillum furvescens DSM 4134 TaxID=1122208 RepID=A0A3D9KVT5_MARFU|nr:TldD/PmbA family protein [Marinoscillum furvescens]RED91770.1 putative Zn-dependent protease [Marinoscillum furvescens DSM 4134]